MAVLFADPVFLQHNTGQHPECAARLEAVYQYLATHQLDERFTRGEIQPADIVQLKRVHGTQHIQKIEAFAARGGGSIDSDTLVSPRSWDVALRAAGCAMTAVDQVLSEKHKTAVCLTRPPGHHALPSRAMGFCLFNNVALAAQHAIHQHELERILIVDWDVHHGNGTQDIFYDEEHVTFFSTHRWPFYPGTGQESETGSGKGLGTTFNVPIRWEQRGQFMQKFAHGLRLAAERCKPQLLLISAGFDAHRDDPIGSLELDSADFTQLTNLVTAVADEFCDGRVVSLLEGGYNVNALAESVGFHLQALLEHDG